jgi:hypothetical protein
LRPEPELGTIHVLGNRCGRGGRLNEVELLTLLRQRCRGAKPPPADEIEQALERGSARLMALEAEMQLVESRRSSDRPGADARAAESLSAQIVALRQALAEVRERTRTMSSDRLVGFVLPAKAPGVIGDHETPR